MYHPLNLITSVFLTLHRNNSDPMSKLGLVMVLILMAGRTIAQGYPASNNGSSNPDNGSTNHFVLIQAEGNQAFYVRVDKQVYSSSLSGHLILAPLKDSTYTIVIGFPGQTYAEQRFLLIVRGKDFFLNLRLQDGRWELDDVKSQPLPDIADPLSADRRLASEVKKDDSFSQMMSAIVRDTAVMYSSYAVSPADPSTGNSGDSAVSAAKQPSPDTSFAFYPPKSLDSSGASLARDIQDTASLSQSRRLPDTAATGFSTATQTSPHITTGARSSSLGVTPSSPTGVMKVSEHKSSKSLLLVYEDHANPRAPDTIDVVIPVDPMVTPMHSARSADSSRSIHPVDSMHSTTIRPSQASDSPSVSTGVPSKSSLPFVNSDCHSFATDYDVDKLRVKMLDAGSDDDRILAARKVFRIKCFTTKQLRALCELFPSDPGKFQFLQTAYPYVSDGQFVDLVDLFTDAGYAGKFRTMTGGH